MGRSAPEKQSWTRRLANLLLYDEYKRIQAIRRQRKALRSGQGEPPGNDKTKATEENNDPE